MKTPQNTTSCNPNQIIIISEIKKLKHKRIIFWTLLIISLFFPLLLFPYGNYFQYSIILLLLFPIFGILFIRIENTIAIANFIHFWKKLSYFPSVKYSIIFLYITTIIVISNIDSIFDFSTALYFIDTFILIFIFLLNGSISSRSSAIGTVNNIPQNAFHNNPGKQYKGMFILLFVIFSWVWLFLLFLGSLASGLAHGRFLFFWFNRKPRKAVIRDGKSWLIKN